MGSTFEAKYIQSIETSEASQLYSDYVSALEIENDRINADAGFFVETGELDMLGEQIVFTDNVFDEIESAKDWLRINHQKWKPPLAVRVPDGWLIGGWCPS